MDLKNQLSTLNNPRFGSFGEYIYESINKKKGIVRKHTERVDFVLNNTQIDVKSSRFLNTPFSKVRIYPGKKIPNIQYIYIQFYSDKIIISNKEYIISKLSYEEIHPLFDAWLKRKPKPKSKLNKSEQQNNLIPIKTKIRNYFFNMKGWIT